MEARIVSIEAWREPEGGWTWNNQWLVAELSREQAEKLTTPRKLCRYLREIGRLSEHSRGRVRVEHTAGDPDMYEVCDKGTGEPLFALEISY